MSEEPSEKRTSEDVPDAGEATRGGSTIYRLCEEVVLLREKNDRQHKLFEQRMKEVQQAMQASFHSFAADTQRAYQQLRQELHGEKRASLALLNDLMEIGFDLERIADAWTQHIEPATPPADGAAEWTKAVEGWAESVCVQARKVRDTLVRHGIHRYDAALGSAYNPALHERVGSRPAEGMPPLRVAEQTEHGYASQQPEFVLRRAKVIVSE
jgi:molecular chaperone GrpE (heat shock protein)